MQLGRAAAALPFLLLLSSAAAAFNITEILGKHPSLSTFNHYLTATGLAAEINRCNFACNPITVCAVNNAAMAGFLSRRPSRRYLKDLLSLHTIGAYYDATFLHNIPGSLVDISTLLGEFPLVEFFDYPDSDKVGVTLFRLPHGRAATLVRSLFALPPNISIIQISDVLPLRPPPLS